MTYKTTIIKCKVFEIMDYWSMMMMMMIIIIITIIVLVHGFLSYECLPNYCFALKLAGHWWLPLATLTFPFCHSRYPLSFSLPLHSALSLIAFTGKTLPLSVCLKKY